MTSPAGWTFSSRRVLQLIDLPQPVRDVVPSDAVLVHYPSLGFAELRLGKSS